ncbi:hypothetical protein STXM2123_5882 [Streptomyces sp. F-3]|nr:hypothetical protein STXM2123_5882 [Streptomyces sp. F-3]
MSEFCWTDLKTRDLAGAAAFFSRTLGRRFGVPIDGHLVGSVSCLRIWTVSSCVHRNAVRSRSPGSRNPIVVLCD